MEFLSDCYFIDMELCNLTLHEYINYSNHGVTFDFEIHETSAPVFVSNDCSHLMRMRNVWTIIEHIALGLEFMHTHKQVHRDLKPKNSMSHECHTDYPVLYSLQENRWKLTDFGLACEATSKRALSTANGFGTTCYRAPELLMGEEETLKFTNKVDIWALGCVLYEIVTSQSAFSNDYDTRDYAVMGHELQPVVTPLSEFFDHHVSQAIIDLLNREWQSRPKTSDVLSLVRSHIQLLSLPIAQTLVGLHSYPSSGEWNEVIGSSDDTFLHRLLDIYRKTGEKKGAFAVGQLIRESAVQQSPGTSSSANIPLWQELAEMYYERKEMVAAAKAFEDAIKEQPKNYWLWMRLYDTYIALDDVAGVITACEKGISQFPNWSPVMVLSNLYAAKGDYNTAILTYTRLVNSGWEDSLWEYLLSESNFSFPNRKASTIQFLKQYKSKFALADCRLLRKALASGENKNSVKTWLSTDIHLFDSCTIHHAAWMGNLEFLKARAEEGVDLTVQDRSGLTVLHLAVWNMHANVVTWLLQSADKKLISIVGHSGTTPLHLATWNNDIDTVKSLLEAGANPSARNKDGSTPMHWASRGGHTSLIRPLKLAGAWVMETREDGSTPLHCAAKYGRVESIQKLIQERALYSAVNKAGDTPLHLATTHGRTDAIHALVKAGAKCSTQNSAGTTPLHYAAEQGLSDVVKEMVSKGANISLCNKKGWTPLHSAANNGHFETVSKLLAAGAKWTVTTRTGDTPVHLAAENGHDEVIRRLVEGGADCSAQSPDGYTPLHLSSMNGHVETIRTLLKSGAISSTLFRTGDTPMHLAAVNGHVEAVKALLDAGAEKSARNHEGDEPIHVAALQGHVIVLEVLIAGKANISAINRSGDTPMHRAAQQGNVQVIATLYKFGALPSVQNFEGQSPLHLAAMNGSVGAVNQLLDAGANIDVLDHNGRSPIDCARRYRHDDLVDILRKARARWGII